ncbi:hypothetical protein [Chengkuizengella marina]|uniref:hypothetical protein n=1 Tax=Chengkuizengella marina TaxID=2507566 RepID=UPI00136A1707|nr:hypothetical protein [Chengkuizengella marina]
MAHQSIENLNEIELLHDVDEWKKKVQDKPLEVLNDMPWLFFVMLDRLSENKKLKGEN